MNKFSSSALVTYERISPHRNSPRKHVIDTITIHCYVGQVTAKSGVDNFATTEREVSSNYVIGYDGSIGLSVPESDRSWCSSNRENDHRAITIEVASETAPPYSVTNEAYAALISLLVDICKRNSIKKLLWQADKNLIGEIDKQNMTVHRWFTSKECPGKYLYDKHYEIADSVNSILLEENTELSTIYRVNVGSFTDKQSAENLANQLKKDGYESYITFSGVI